MLAICYGSDSISVIKVDLSVIYYSFLFFCLKTQTEFWHRRQNFSMRACLCVCEGDIMNFFLKAENNSFFLFPHMCEGFLCVCVPV